MPSYNKVTLVGHLTRDPELKFLPSGAAVVNFGLAMNDSYMDRETGERKDVPCFVDIEAWGQQAEVIAEHFTKGRPILVDGALKFDSWETDDGTRRSKLKVRLYRFTFIDTKADAEAFNNGNASDNPGPAASRSPVRSAQEMEESIEEDIPF